MIILFNIKLRKKEDFVETIDKICEQKVAEREKVFH